MPPKRSKVYELFTSKGKNQYLCNYCKIDISAEDAGNLKRHVAEYCKKGGKEAYEKLVSDETLSKKPKIDQNFFKKRLKTSSES